MRKYGKYEKRPEGVPAKQPTAKSMLLQTYLTSLLCMALCVTMLLGTTYAWFTSEVKSEDNEIYIGMLDAKLELLKKIDGVEQWVDVEQNPAVKLYDNTIAWEPGYTSLETIKVGNDGDLSFRYALTFTDGKLNGVENDEELIKAAQFFTVYVHEGNFSDTDPKPISFADIEDSAADENGTWRAVRMGKDPATLADILTRELPVVSGNMEEKNEADTYIVALHMNGEEKPAKPVQMAGESVDAYNARLQEWEQWQGNLDALMGKRIGLNVKLTGYQRTHEADAFGAGYDLQAQVVDLGPMTVNYKNWPNHSTIPSGEKIDLDDTYQFLPVESSEEGQASPKKKYFADFAIYADKPVKLNSIVLAGYYEFFCEGFNGGDWIVLESDDPSEIKPGEEIRLVNSMGAGLDITYEMLCDFGNDGIGFLCGIKNKAPENVGTTITVQLRVYETQLNSENHYEIVDLNNYTVAGTETYLIEQ